MHPPAIDAFWQRFLRSNAARNFAAPELYDTLRIGGTRQSADEGAQLILDGVKTATSSRISDYQPPTIPPFEGALSIVLDGANAPVAVVETTELKLRTLPRDLHRKLIWDQSLGAT